MRCAPLLSALLLSVATVLVSPSTASAQPASQEEVVPAAAPATAPASDEDRYAEREATDQKAADFKGGDGTLIISGGVVVLLVVLILVIVVF